MMGESFRAFIIEALIKGGYDNLIYIYEKPAMEAYISRKNQKLLSNKGEMLYFNRARTNELIIEGTAISKRAEKETNKIFETDLKCKTNSELEFIFKKVYALAMDFLEIYRCTESTYTLGIERKLFYFINKKVRNKNEANRIFSFLANPSLNKRIIQEQEKIVEDFNIPSKILSVFSTLCKVGKKRLFFRSAANNIVRAFIAILHEVGRRNFLSPLQTESCLFTEITNLLERKQINVDEINKRSLCFAAYGSKNGYFFVTGKKAKNIISKVKLKIPSKINKFTGDVANIGRAKGTVKIILPGTTLDGMIKLKIKEKEMKKNEILVTTVTEPTMVLVCKKAAAIIADEGGINSHAAIMSRELNIPCIVGTKIGTKLLHDGDLVEVDAYKGTIKILNK